MGPRTRDVVGIAILVLVLIALVIGLVVAGLPS